MTNDMPDKIRVWIEKSPVTEGTPWVEGMWVDIALELGEPPSPEDTDYLRATPARIHADELVDALESIYEICVEPAEIDHKSVRGWIEVTARDILARIEQETTHGKKQAND